MQARRLKNEVSIFNGNFFLNFPQLFSTLLNSSQLFSRKFLWGVFTLNFEIEMDWISLEALLFIDFWKPKIFFWKFFRYFLFGCRRNSSWIRRVHCGIKFFGNKNFVIFARGVIVLCMVVIFLNYFFLTMHVGTVEEIFGIVHGGIFLFFCW